jgi:cytochrome oxidase assembly protein ShyY1
LISYRRELLSKPAVDITPTNAEKRFLWSKAQDLNKFEDEWSFKKVKLRGIFDYTKEFQVEREKNGEKGVLIITPFYTHLNENDDESAILVNRGWVPEDLRYMRMHYATEATGEITGILYRGDAKTKYSVSNEPLTARYTNVTPYDFALVAQIKNRDEASQFMLLQVDEDEKARQVLPASPSVNDLTKWQISAERHQAYATIWKYLSFTGVLANTALWLYF